MSIRDGLRRLNPATPGHAVDQWVDEADAISLQRVDDVVAQARPSNVEPTYLQQEYDALGSEQTTLWSAEGERKARPHLVRARRLDQVAAATAFLLTESETEVRQAHAAHQHAHRALAGYVRRESSAKWRYGLVWPILAIGDASSVLSAAIALGDIPWVAAGQACAAGLAAACAGLVGVEWKHARDARARQRDPEQLTEDQRPYARLFNGAGKGAGIVKLVTGLSLLTVCLLAVGVFTLRSSIEGSASGVTFALLAAATALGSFLVTFWASDEVADILAATAKRVHKAERRHRRLAAALTPKEQAQAEETARSIHAEHQLRGQAAQKRVESLAWRVQRRNPHVLGHGYPTGEPTGVIGRRPRQGDAP